MHTLSRLAGWLILALAFSASAAAQTANPPRTTPAADPTKDQQNQQQRSVDQPGNNAPVWRDVRSGQPNFTSIPGRETGVLVQPQARFPGPGRHDDRGRGLAQVPQRPDHLLRRLADRAAWCSRFAAFYFTQGPAQAARQAHRPHDRALHAGRALGALDRRRSASACWRVSGPDHAVRQARAAAGDRLHAVRVADRRWRRTCTTSSRRCSSSACSCMIVIYVRDNLPEKGDLTWLVKARRCSGRARTCRRAASTPARRPGSGAAWSLLCLIMRAAPGLVCCSRTSTSCARRCSRPTWCTPSRRCS